MTSPVLHCLIVEDSNIDQRIMTRVLSRFGRRVAFDFAATIQEARRRLDDVDYSFIFLDNSLPDGRGADFVKELSQNARWGRIPVVMVTDWPSPFMFAKAQSPNVVDVWTKDQFNWGAVQRVMFPRGANRAVM